MMNQNDFLSEAILNRCGFSSRSFLSISFSKGMTTFSICSTLSARALTGKALSSKLKTDFVLFFKSLKSYLFFFCTSQTSFVPRSASSRVVGLAFSLISYQTSSRLRPSKGLKVLFLSFLSTMRNLSNKGRQKEENNKPLFKVQNLEKIVTNLIMISRFHIKRKYFIGRFITANIG